MKGAMDIPTVAPIKPRPNVPPVDHLPSRPLARHKKVQFRILGFFAGAAIAAGGLLILYPLIAGSVLGLPPETKVLVSFGDTMQSPLYEVDVHADALVPHEVPGVAAGDVVMDAVETVDGIYYLIGTRATGVMNLYRMDEAGALVPVTTTATMKSDLSYEPTTARLAYTEWAVPNAGVLGEGYAGVKTVVVLALPANETTIIGEGYDALMLPGGSVLVQGTSTLDAVDTTSLERRTLLARDATQPMPILNPSTGELLVANDVSGLLDYFDVTRGGFFMTYLRSEERTMYPDVLTFAPDGSEVSVRRSMDYATIVLTRGTYMHALKNPTILYAPKEVRFINTP